MADTPHTHAPDEPAVEAVEFLVGLGEPTAKVAVIAGGKMLLFRIDQRGIFGALRSAACALQRMNEAPPVRPAREGE